MLSRTFHDSIFKCTSPSGDFFVVAGHVLLVLNTLYSLLPSEVDRAFVFGCQRLPRKTFRASVRASEQFDEGSTPANEINGYGSEKQEDNLTICQRYNVRFLFMATSCRNS